MTAYIPTPEHFDTLAVPEGVSAVSGVGEYLQVGSKGLLAHYHLDPLLKRMVLMATLEVPEAETWVLATEKASPGRMMAVVTTHTGIMFGKLLVGQGPTQFTNRFGTLPTSNAAKCSSVVEGPHNANLMYICCDTPILWVADIRDLKVYPKPLEGNCRSISFMDNAQKLVVTTDTGVYTFGYFVNNYGYFERDRGMQITATGADRVMTQDDGLIVLANQTCRCVQLVDLPSDNVLTEVGPGTVSFLLSPLVYLLDTDAAKTFVYEVNPSKMVAQFSGASWGAVGSAGGNVTSMYIVPGVWAVFVRTHAVEVHCFDETLLATTAIPNTPAPDTPSPPVTPAPLTEPPTTDPPATDPPSTDTPTTAAPSILQLDSEVPTIHTTPTPPQNVSAEPSPASDSDSATPGGVPTFSPDGNGSQVITFPPGQEVEVEDMSSGNGKEEGGVTTGPLGAAGTTEGRMGYSVSGEDIVFGVAGMAAVVGGVGGPAAVSTIAKVIVIRQLRCEDVPLRELQWDISPLGISLGSSDAKYLIGAVIGNWILLVVLCIASFICTVVHGCLHFFVVMLIPTLFLLPGMFIPSVMLLRYGDTPFGIVIGVSGLIVCIGIPTALYCFTFHRFSAHTTDAGGEGSFTQKYLLGDYTWTARHPDYTFVRRHGAAFLGYTEVWRGMIFAEVAVVFILGVLATWEDPPRCVARNVLVAVVLFLYTVASLLWRPFLSKVDNIVQGSVAVLLLAASCVLTKRMAEGGTSDLAQALLIAVCVLTTIKSGLDVFLCFYRRSQRNAAIEASLQHATKPTTSALKKTHYTPAPYEEVVSIATGSEAEMEDVEEEEVEVQTHPVRRAATFNTLPPARTLEVAQNDAAEVASQGESSDDSGDDMCRGCIVQARAVPVLASLKGSILTGHPSGSASAHPTPRNTSMGSYYSSSFVSALLSDHETPLLGAATLPPSTAL